MLGFTNEDDGTGNEKKIPVGPQIFGKHGAAIFNEEFDGVAQKESPAGLPDFVLKFKSVYKCRICPRIVCLTEETMRTHLNSKVGHGMLLFACKIASSSFFFFSAF